MTPERRATPEGRWAHLVANARVRARSKGLEWDEGFMQRFVDTPPLVCEYSGEPLDFTVGDGAHPLSPSLDRLDPSRGYVAGNVHACALALNVSKHNHELVDLVAVSRLMARAVPRIRELTIRA